MNTTTAGPGLHHTPRRSTPPGGGAARLPVVLLVDDVPDNLLALKGMLRRADVEIVTATSGREALEVLLERDVAVAIIDIMMPELDGYELAELIRGAARTRHVPIIFVTAATKAEYRAFAGYELGAIDFLYKPLNDHVLKAKVDVLVTLDRQQREAERARAETQVLLDLAQAIGQAEKPADIYEPALDAIHDLLGVDRSAILLFDETDRMRFHASRGLSDSYRVAVDGHSPWSREARDPQPMLIADVTRDDSVVPYRSIFATEGIRAIGFVPLFSGKLLGKFMLYWDQPRTFSERDGAITRSVAAQVAEALDRASAHEGLRLAEEKLRESALRTTADLQDMSRLHAIGSLCARPETDLTTCLEAILDGAISITRADKGNIQLLEGDSTELTIAAQRGFDEPFLTFFARVGLGHASACGTALKAAERTIVEDIAQSAVFSGQPSLDVLFGAGVRAVLSTPLISSGGNVLGMISTHFAEPHRCSERDLRLIDLLTRQAADYLERKRAEQRLRDSEASLRHELVAKTRLQELSGRLVQQGDLKPLLHAILVAAAELTGTDKGDIQIFDEKKGTRRIFVHHGLGPRLVQHLAEEGWATCAQAADAMQRVIVDDVETLDQLRGTVELEIVLEDGIRAVQSTPLLSRDGRLLGMLNNHYRVTGRPSEDKLSIIDLLARQAADLIERSRAEDELRDTRALLDTLLTTAPVGFAYLDRQLRFVRVNDQLAEANGIPASAHIGKHVGEIVPSLLPMVETVTQTILETGEAVKDREFIGETQSAPGKQGVWSESWYPVRDAAGDVVGFGAVVQDITVRKQVEEALRENEARLRSIVAQFPAGVGVMDTSGHWFLTNATMDRYVRDTIPSALQERTSRWRFVDQEGEVIPPENWPGQRALRGETVIPGLDGIFTDDDGRKTWMRVSAAPLYSESGEIIGATAVVQDISVHKQLEQEREAAAVELQQTLHYNEIFAGVLAHDLRNPLNAIQTATQLVLHREHGKADLAPLRRVLASGDRMARLIDQLLDFTKARIGGGFDLHSREANLSQLCAQVLGEIELAYPAWKVTVDSRGDLAGTWDPDRLLQVVSNLVTNAGQHGTAGAEIQLALDGTGGDAVMLQVHNKGSIPETLLPDIFAPFRGTRQQQSSTGGLGLGIYIAREIVRSHGGSIDVASSESAGTTFTVTLPRRAQHSSLALTYESPSEEHSGEGTRILQRRVGVGG